MGVERLIARIADVLGGKCGEPHVLILRQDQIRNGDVAEIGALKAVTYADGLGPLGIQNFFYLPGSLPQRCRVDGIFSGSFGGQAEERSPCGTVKSRVGIIQRSPLIETRI